MKASASLVSKVGLFSLPVVVAIDPYGASNSTSPPVPQLAVVASVALLGSLFLVVVGCAVCKYCCMRSYQEPNDGSSAYLLTSRQPFNDSPMPGMSSATP